MILSLLLTLLLSSPKELLTPLVRPFTGTDGGAWTSPAAAYPFGMMQLGPDTGTDGYSYGDSLICGFSHEHFSGIRISDYPGLRMMPTTGYTADTLDRAKYSSGFSHSREKAEPGLYEVLLNNGVHVRLTVGERSGMQEYTFPAGVTPQVVIDLGENYDPKGSAILVSGTTVHGARKGVDGPVTYFSIEFTEAFTVGHSSSRGVVLNFPARRYERIILARSGISSCDVTGAQLNMAFNCYDTFDEMLADTRDEWNRFLGTVECPFEDLTRRRIFYTALYHCALHPSIYSDVNGHYSGMDGKIWELASGERHSGFLLWGTFRGLHPLLFRLTPELSGDFLRSMLFIYKEKGTMPLCEIKGCEIDWMTGYHSAPIIAGALAEGQSDFDVKAALTALVRSSMRGPESLKSFREHGVVLADGSTQSVSATLEYAYDDWCVAQVAKWLAEHSLPGKEKDNYWKIYDRFMVSAQYWRNVYDPKTGFMRARLGGRWAEPFDPDAESLHYSCGTARQNSFFVPHDIAGLMRASGGSGRLCEKLDSLFDGGHYDHSLPPLHHTPWMYALAGKNARTRERVGKIMEDCYKDSPDGLCGYDFGGTLSAWYVLSAQEKFPVCPGAPLGSVTFVPKTIVVNPVFEMSSDTFRDSLRVSLSGEGNIWWRADSLDYQLYTGPFTVKESCTLQAYGSVGGTNSFITESKVTKLP